jgi:hypothetical protein
MAIVVHFFNGKHANIANATQVQGGSLSAPGDPTGAATLDCKDANGKVIAQFLVQQIIGYEVHVRSTRSTRRTSS